MRRNFTILIVLLLLSAGADAQLTGSLTGLIQDQTGAVIPGATITLKGPSVFTARSDKEGHYAFTVIPEGSYSLTAAMSGFASIVHNTISIRHGKPIVINMTMMIEGIQADVTVSADSQQVGLEADQNSSAHVIRGQDLDALDDDPGALQAELTALAGPAAGTNGGQLYVDGFSGGQIPQKSTIKEIKINQNPMSAEFDRLGYGRIEILTKPGADRISAHLASSYLNSVLNTANPLVKTQPHYQFFWVRGDLSGPIRKGWSYLLNALEFRRENQAIVRAVNPEAIGNSLEEAFPTPSSLLNVTLRTDAQLGPRQVITIQDFIYRSAQSGSGVGALVLPSQSVATVDWENTLDVKDVLTITPKLVNETSMRWRRIHQTTVPTSLKPSITVQGAFTTGGNSLGSSNDHQDLVEVQNYTTASIGHHSLRFGTRLRSYREASYSTSGINGSYLFASVSDYISGRPYQYTGTVIDNPNVRTLLFDGALFVQDEWRARPNLNVSLGFRLEGQSHIRDPLSPAPRIALAWSPKRNGPTVFRAGYGWFYDRFTVPTQVGGNASPYLTQVIRNDGINRRNYIVKNPSSFDPNVPMSAGALSDPNTQAIPYKYSLDPNFHAALDMQSSVGIDQAIGKHTTLSLSYLYTRGLHQYLTNNVSAPVFDTGSYIVVGPTPDSYNYQFQSGGLYKQHQLIVSTNTHASKFSLQAVYTFNHAESDTQGVTYFPSVASNPSFDFGRASFGIKHQFTLQGAYTFPGDIELSPFFVFQSGVPFNITIGDDLTQNNQSNARPTYGTCGSPDVIETQYGCLDSSPTGKGERVIPFNLGTGPINALLNLSLRKSVDFGKSDRGANTHAKKLTLTVGAVNTLNIVNLGAPNGVLTSPLFGRSQSLATGAFASPSPGNRTIYFTGMFSF